jgi:hypothetical protein
MLNCFYFVGVWIVSVVVYFGLVSVPGTIPGVILTFLLLFNVTWGAVLLNLIIGKIRSHIKDFYELKSILVKKMSYQDQMTNYKKEMQSELLDKYREFEETMMRSIKDSKLLAAVLKDSGYSDILTSYNNSIKMFLSEIHGSDRKLNDLKAEMLTAQNDKFGYGTFLPRNFKI